MAGTMYPQVHAHLQENTAPRAGTYDRTIELAWSRERGAAKRVRPMMNPLQRWFVWSYAVLPCPWPTWERRFGWDPRIANS